MQLPLFQPFANEWILFALIVVGIFMLIGLGEFFHAAFNWSPEVTRKFIHIWVGLMVSLSPFYFKTNLQLIALSILFIGTNWITLTSDKFQSMHGTGQKSYGTVYFPLAFLVLVIFWWDKPISLVISMLVMTVSDSVASFWGTKTKNPRAYTIWGESKTWEGSTAMFLSALLIVYMGTEFFAWYFGAAFFLPLPVLFGLAGFTAFMATLAEAVSFRGSDNFSIPLITFLTYELYLINFTHGTLAPFLTWTIISGIFLYFAGRQKALSASGSLGAFLMGILVFGSGGVQWILPLIIFFIGSSLLSKFSRSSESGFRKGSNRNILQILSNGSVATIIALVNFFHPAPFLYYLYLGAVASAMADTWATEIGIISPHKPRHILSLNLVEKGTSGGITLIGSMGAVAGAMAVSSIGLLFGIPENYFWIITASGFLGNVVDSILGGSIQSLFICTVCGKNTEKRNHCDFPANRLSGIKWIDNDMVNFMNTIAGIILVLTLGYYFG